ncbi:hypothetical protein PsYK624_033570 [Phanerochaete sordida]|uniref:Uncharacterized protein n=1 Tax=Phanerochaete sordida TaxID=48140 RepID=A0A9P3G462_9APHY|nr:hypothetical protein PsYK624_033570 [Phanerochaete sordida]
MRTRGTLRLARTLNVGSSCLPTTTTPKASAGLQRLACRSVRRNCTVRSLNNTHFEKAVSILCASCTVSRLDAYSQLCPLESYLTSHASHLRSRAPLLRRSQLRVQRASFPAHTHASPICHFRLAALLGCCCWQRIVFGHRLHVLERRKGLLRLARRIQLHLTIASSQKSCLGRGGRGNAIWL